MERSCGVLLPISALPSKYGIGSFGKWAYKFVDLLKLAGHDYWQVLPLVQTGYGDSPYATCCDNSGNPYFIDLELLRDEKLLTYREVDEAIDKSFSIDYGKLYVERYKTLRLAFSRFDVKNSTFAGFLKRGEYRDYALYMALKQAFNAPWYEWDDCYKFRDEESLKDFEKKNKSEVLFWQFIQFKFQKQYRELKKYANKKGIKIIGDLPLYVAYDSVDVWVNPSDFKLDDGYKPSVVAGVPPDYFAQHGQLWGNPIYNYDNMRLNGFDFWKKRLKHARKLYDIVRIDHFRALDRYWAIKYGEQTAENGWWEEAPKMELLNAIGTNKLIAEDLGMIDDGVRNLLSESQIPGLKVILFSFDGGDDNPYLPWNIEENSVVYTGTHDNNTVLGWLKSLSEDEFEIIKAKVKRSMEYYGIIRPVSGIYKTAEAILDITYASKAQLAIIPMQDILSLDDDYRINTPNEINCWTMRLKESYVFIPTVINKMKQLAKRFNRT